MAHVKTMLQCLIDPADPVREINGVVTAILESYPIKEQDKILSSVEKTIQQARSDISAKAAAEAEAKEVKA